jgi:hypothetical protein
MGRLAILGRSLNYHLRRNAKEMKPFIDDQDNPDPDDDVR